MKKILATVFAASLMLVGSQAYAQLVPGAGYLFASEASKSDSNKSEATPYHGFYVGASYNIPLAAGLGVAPGFYVDMLLHNTNTEGGSAVAGLTLMGSYREVALNIPLNLTYSYEFGKDMAIRLFAGPVFQYGVISKTTINGTLSGSILGIKYSYSDGASVNHYDAEDGSRNPFNIYLGGGLGFQVGDILFTVGYDHNLLDIDKYDGVTTNRNQIKAGINFAF